MVLLVLKGGEKMHWGFQHSKSNVRNASSCRPGWRPGAEYGPASSQWCWGAFDEPGWAPLSTGAHQRRVCGSWDRRKVAWQMGMSCIPAVMPPLPMALSPLGGAEEHLAVSPWPHSGHPGEQQRNRLESGVLETDRQTDSMLGVVQTKQQCPEQLPNMYLGKILPGGGWSRNRRLES